MRVAQVVALSPRFIDNHVEADGLNVYADARHPSSPSVFIGDPASLQFYS